MEIEWKQSFIDKYKELTDIEKFLDYSTRFLRRSVRVNTIKIEINELKERLEKKGLKLEQVPWCKEGFYVEGERRDLGNLAEHFLGYIYIQEAASMIPPLALEPNERDIVLDMCSAPGSKSSQMAAMMNNKGLLISNESSFGRVQPLSINLQRCGIANTMVTIHDGRLFGKMHGFDKILVDAPCSGTGTIRKSLKTTRIWNPNICYKMAGAQKKLLQSGFDALKDKGTIVYSTCSLEPEEDEMVVQNFLDKNPNAKLEKISLPGLKTEALNEYGEYKFDSKISCGCVRIWPQDYDTEGFFVAKFKKE
ncbi:NOL1/NOP2/sun family putative RNA methylase [Candidatus Woesearchaeota archaeon]|nr:NOL1/NOP2/sun family putative RNA methylase [Candidatus Woesearchaeota archaeon]